MKFGVCAGVVDAPAILDAGFDYIEVGATGFSGMDEHWDRSPYEGLPILATNLFFDQRIHLFGAHKTPYLDYSMRTIERAASLGVPVMVIGSGGPRTAPDDIDGDSAFVDVVAELSQIAQPFGIALAPESLNRTETNVGNSLRSLAIRLRARGVGYTADSYHILFEWDAEGRKVWLDDLMEDQIPFAPTHVHVANLPRTGVDAEDPMLQAFAGRLAELEYGGNVSLECSRESGFDLAATLGALKSLFGRPACVSQV
ncbi:MAG TPA: TIM barrel protein [Fimbriimonadaceae bacterium]|nr:TIM barrel protein [Fimbriimonadaceae bacterium]